MSYRPRVTAKAMNDWAQAIGRIWSWVLLESGEREWRYIDWPRGTISNEGLAKARAARPDDYHTYVFRRYSEPTQAVRRRADRWLAAKKNGGWLPHDYRDPRTTSRKKV